MRILQARSPAKAPAKSISCLSCPFLSAQGWTVTPLEVADATEARGINTKDDLAFFQSLYNKAP